MPDPAKPVPGAAAVRLTGVTKTYPIYPSAASMALDQIGVYGLLPRSMRPAFREFGALSGIDLEIRKGDRIGIVGRNGAGKTTLLKLISGRFRPTKGEIYVAGAVQALMQVGQGFHPEFTGRQNIESALRLQGLTGTDLAAAMADVVDFVELEEHLDQPLRTYSLGMATRLQFAVATAIEPDILIVDEILGAGDAYFAVKSANRMRALAERGAALLLVSHSTQQVLNFCDKAIWLHQGKIVRAGTALDVVNAYDVHIERAIAGQVDADVGASPTVTLSDGRQVHRWPGKSGLKIDRIDVLGFEGHDEVALPPGAPIPIEFQIRSASSRTFRVAYLLTIWSPDGRRIARLQSPVDEFDCPIGQTRKIKIDVENLRLHSGTYFVSFSIYEETADPGKAVTSGDRLDVITHAIRIEIESPNEHNNFGSVYLAADWQVVETR